MVECEISGIDGRISHRADDENVQRVQQAFHPPLEEDAGVAEMASTGMYFWAIQFTT